MGPKLLYPGCPAALFWVQPELYGCMYRRYLWRHHPRVERWLDAGQTPLYLGFDFTSASQAALQFFHYTISSRGRHIPVIMKCFSLTAQINKRQMYLVMPGSHNELLPYMVQSGLSLICCSWNVYLNSLRSSQLRVTAGEQLHQIGLISIFKLA